MFSNKPTRTPTKCTYKFFLRNNARLVVAGVAGGLRGGGRGGGGGGGGTWDQFGANESKFGSSTSYSDEFYTTRLDK